MKWENDAILLLDELVQPIPLFVRPMAKRSVKKKIIEIAQQASKAKIEKDDVVHGYIAAAPKKDVNRLRSFLDEKRIDYTSYEHYLKES
ncbi:DUF2621 family protein [Caldalkalibacillus salinus]|uniref:DUF2621 family protein n=1 Tax=Caldalkalibacillus salinus TaxID=2803787 RepID=UPI0019223414|nr:DUF2621 family protein [Caldalkalibacillus salinus]